MVEEVVAGGSPLVLIVDDDQAYCDAIGEILNSAGYRTFKTDSVANAVMVLGKIIPDVILCDTMMPVADGGLLLRIVRSDGRWRRIPAVTVSAKAMISDKEAAFAAGATGFLSKPFSAAELLAEIGRQLAQVSAQRDVAA